MEGAGVGGALRGRRGLGGRVRWGAGCGVYWGDRPAPRHGVAPLRVRRARAALGRADWACYAAARPHPRPRDVLHLGTPRRARHVRGHLADGGAGRARAELGRECMLCAGGGVGCAVSRMSFIDVLASSTLRPVDTHIARPPGMYIHPALLDPALLASAPLSSSLTPRHLILSHDTRYTVIPTSPPPPATPTSPHPTPTRDKIHPTTGVGSQNVHAPPRSCFGFGIGLDSRCIIYIYPTLIDPRSVVLRIVFLSCCIPFPLALLSCHIFIPRLHIDSSPAHQ
ncbi:hypothetical protein C8R44DRAFT_818168 [Mycena epipterygia]|nr:hypothetical protein C8R44DRAFT_818168 [Mycena epipterygia]